MALSGFYQISFHTPNPTPSSVPPAPPQLLSEYLCSQRFLHATACLIPTASSLSLLPFPLLLALLFPSLLLRTSHLTLYTYVLDLLPSLLNILLHPPTLCYTYLLISYNKNHASAVQPESPHPDTRHSHIRYAAHPQTTHYHVPLFCALILYLRLCL